MSSIYKVMNQNVVLMLLVTLRSLRSDPKKKRMHPKGLVWGGGGCNWEQTEPRLEVGGGTQTELTDQLV